MRSKVENPLRILIIEDNHDLAHTLCMMFDVLGHGAVATHNGIEGIVKAKEICPDIIFCDIGLPGMNGYEVAKSIRKADECKDIYLVALSGYAQPKDIQAAQEAGFNCHVAKPVDMIVMVQVLTKCQEYMQEISS